MRTLMIVLAMVLSFVNNVWANEFVVSNNGEIFTTTTTVGYYPQYEELEIEGISRYSLEDFDVSNHDGHVEIIDNRLAFVRNDGSVVFATRQQTGSITYDELNVRQIQ